MKPTTEARVARILTRVSPYLSAGQLGALAEIVEYELRAQDRDTRHECAEAVNGISRIYDAFQGGDHACQIVIRAHAACMNTQAI